MPMCATGFSFRLLTPDFRLLFAVARAHDGLDVAADVEVAFEFDADGVAGGDEVFEDDVDDVLVEDFHLAERVDVELQTLQLDAALVGHVFEAQDGEIGEVREGADGRELGHLELDADFAARVLVGEGVERVEVHLRARRRADVEALLVDGRGRFGRRHASLTPSMRRQSYYKAKPKTKKAA